MDNKMELRIQQVSEKLQVPKSTIRYWGSEFSDIVNPKRTNGGQRRYSEDDIVSLHKIKRLLHHKNRTIDEARSILIKGNADKEKIDWENQSILITGGTGFFGRHFCKTMIERYHPKVLRIYSRDAIKQQEIRKQFSEGVRYFIGDVRDHNRLKRAMEGVDIVIHAACLSEIRACEYNPLEAVKTNIFGTNNIIDAAIDAGVKKVMALSTDKAVYPVTIYGATALCVEKIFIQGNVYAGPRATRFSCVRCGNVIGSRGSIISFINEQKSRQTVTIADKQMSRFWITMEQASELVIRGLEIMEGGEIFVPKTPSIRMVDLIQAVLPECEISFNGSRSVHKVHEELISKEDGSRTVLHNGSYIILPDQWSLDDGNGMRGERVPDGFKYTSDNNDSWLSVEDIRSTVSDDLHRKVHSGEQD